ncbi:ATP synthase subunit f, mitochondrial-like [Mesocricetus auratus]|uniref:ATP synthase F(0) complex subunit f, mitochondrial n=1 Tax=Mesocricetus auratus TaxID=10036 RepID=A0ABM2XDB8_MESAU|nr:ATP synthase subunit f, mitochondrial-like [Mesocricetus auratus]
MASLVSLKGKKLMEVKLGELPSWILMQNSTPRGTVGAFQRGYDRYYNKCINVWKGSILGINMVLAAYVVFSYCLSYQELNHEQQGKFYWRRVSVDGTAHLCTTACHTPIREEVNRGRVFKS